MNAEVALWLEDLHRTRHWKKYVKVATETQRHALTTWLIGIHEFDINHFDPRIGVDRRTADSNRREIVQYLERALEFSAALGLSESHIEDVQKVIAEIEEDDKAVTFSMVTVGWPSLAGQRGKATAKAWAVRHVAVWVPEMDGRYEIIAAFVRYLGIEKCTPQYARSVVDVRKGRT